MTKKKVPEKKVEKKASVITCIAHNAAGVWAYASLDEAVNDLSSDFTIEELEESTDFFIVDGGEIKQVANLLLRSRGLEVDEFELQTVDSPVKKEN